MERVCFNDPHMHWFWEAGPPSWVHWYHLMAHQEDGDDNSHGEAEGTRMRKRMSRGKRRSMMWSLPSLP